MSNRTPIQERRELCRRWVVARTNYRMACHEAMRTTSPEMVRMEVASAKNYREEMRAVAAQRLLRMTGEVTMRKAVRSGAGLGDAVVGVVAERDELRALTQEMLATLRVNLLRGTLRTDDDAFFERLLNKWSGWSAASPNDEASRREPRQ